MHYFISFFFFLGLVFVAVYLAIGLWQNRPQSKKVSAKQATDKTPQAEPQQSANPLYSLTSQLDAAAVLMTLTAAADSPISEEERAEIHSILENELELSHNDAKALLSKSSQLVSTAAVAQHKIGKILRPVEPMLSREQAIATMNFLARVARLHGGPSPQQEQIIYKAAKALAEKMAQR